MARARERRSADVAPSDLARLQRDLRASDPRVRWEAVRGLRDWNLADTSLRRLVAKALLLRIVDPDPYVRHAVSNTMLRLDVRSDPETARLVRLAASWLRVLEQAPERRIAVEALAPSPETDLEWIPASAGARTAHHRRAAGRRALCVPGEEPAAGKWSEYGARELSRLPSRRLRVLRAEEVTPADGEAPLAPPPPPMLSHRSFARILSAAARAVGDDRTARVLTALPSTPTDADRVALARGAGERVFSLLLLLARAANADLRTYASTFLAAFGSERWAAERLILSLHAPDRRLREAVARALRESLNPARAERPICLTALTRAESSTRAPERARAVSLLLRANRAGAWSRRGGRPHAA